MDTSALKLFPQGADVDILLRADPRPIRLPFSSNNVDLALLVCDPAPKLAVLDTRASSRQRQSQQPKTQDADSDREQRTNSVLLV